MTDVVKVNSGSMYETKESYSRLVRVGDLIFVSNTAGRDYQTREIPADAVGQARASLQNIAGALEAVGSSLKDVVHRRIFVPDPADVLGVMEVVGEAFRGIDPASTVTCTPLAAPEYKAEIEVTAYVGAADAETRRISVDLSRSRG